MRSRLLRKIAKPADDLLLKRYGSIGLDEDRLAIAKKVDDGDYLEWVIRQWLKNKSITLPEDQSKITAQLHTFTKLKRSPRFEGSKDINSYTPQSLFKLVAEKGETEVSVADQDRSAIVWTGQGENEFISGKIEVYKPKSIEQLMRIGGGPSYTQQGESQGITNWCTTQEYQAQKYFSAGPIFIVKVNGKNLAQYSPKTGDLMDGADDPFETMDIKGVDFHIIRDEIVNLGLVGAGAESCHDYHIFKGDASPLVEQLAYYSTVTNEVKYEAVFEKIGKDPKALAYAMYEARDVDYSEENEDIVATDPEASMIALSYYMQYGHSEKYIKQYPIHMNTIIKATDSVQGAGLIDLAKEILQVLPTTGDFLVERLVDEVDKSGGKFAMDLIQWYKVYVKIREKNIDPETRGIVMDCIAQYPNPAARFAIDIMGARWPEAEPQIIEGIRLGEYMTRFNITPWPEIEARIAAKDGMVEEYMRTLTQPVAGTKTSVMNAIAEGYKPDKALVARLADSPSGLALLYKFSSRFGVEIDGVSHQKLLENEAENNSSINTLSRKLEEWLDDHSRGPIPRNPDLEYLFSYVSDQQMDNKKILLGDRDDYRLSSYMAGSEDERLHKYKYRSEEFPNTFQRFIHAIEVNPIKSGK